MSITIYGFASFKEWADAGYPGAVSFDHNGSRKDAPKTSIAICALEFCGNKVSRDHLCEPHFLARRRRRERAIA